MFSWFSVAPIIMEEAVVHGHAEHKPAILLQANNYKIPVYNRIVSRITGHYQPLCAKDIVYGLQHGQFDSVGTMPEEFNSIYLYPDCLPIKPFRYNGQIVIALRANVDMITGVHKGTEKWDLNLCLPFKKTFKGCRGTNLPFWVRRLPKVVVAFELYRPSISLQDIEGLSKPERYAVVNREGEKMRQAMIRLYHSL